MQFLCTSIVTRTNMSLSVAFTESIETLEQNWTNSKGYCPLKKHKMTIKPNKKTKKQCIEEKTCARGKIPQDWSNRWPADLSTGQIQRKWKVPDLDLQGLLGNKAPPPSKRMAPWKEKKIIEDFCKPIHKKMILNCVPKIAIKAEAHWMVSVYFQFANYVANYRRNLNRTCSEIALKSYMPIS